MTKEQILKAVSERFSCFGGGRGSDYNPIAEALKNYPLQFECGVDVKEVIGFILAFSQNTIDWELQYADYNVPKSVPHIMANKIQVWEEGYAATGEHGTASFLGEYPATSFSQAVAMYLAEHPNQIKYYACNARFHDKEWVVKHSIWACGLYDNESDARKAFG